MTTPPAIFAASNFLAHGGEPHDLHDLWRSWAFDEPVVIVSLLLTAWLYWRGVRRLWRGSRPGAGIRKWEVACFWGGWIALVIALVSPLHPWGRVLFSAHMTQHEVLMLVAAPLLVLGKPLVATLKALPPSWARRLAAAGNNPRWLHFWSVVTNSFVAWLVHAAVLWLWHLPALFQATLDSEFVHALQHTSFLGSALLFWWAILQGRQHALNYGLAVLYMFTTAIHSGLLGALLTFARGVWYPAYNETQSWGLSPLEDQQLGGLIMWVPACLVYIFAGLALFAAWLRESEARVLKREAQSLLMPTPTLRSLLLLATAMAFALGCDNRQEKQAATAMTRGGNPDQGKSLISYYGCGSCHTVPGVHGADANVGPPLDHIATRTYVGGVIKNNPDNLMRWIRDAPGVDPLTGMPNLHVTPTDSRDIASYLYTLR
jgi:cytochrome c oxidase assembly factor CtaG/cytochrome c551/c552